MGASSRQTHDLDLLPRELALCVSGTSNPITLRTSVVQQQQQQEQGDAEGEAGHVKQVRDLSIAEGQKVHLELKVRYLELGSWVR